MNVLRPYDAYTNIINRIDPGPDGVTGNADDGGPVTLYDYRTEYRGAAFVGNQPTNTRDDDQYCTPSKRASQNGCPTDGRRASSYFATKRDILIDKVIANAKSGRF